MLVHVSLPHTDGVSVEGAVPKIVVDYLKSEFGVSNVLVETDGELDDPFESEWFKNAISRQTPGSNLRFYRKQSRMTQQNLAERIGTTKQAICAMEHDTRSISKKNAKVLADLFRTSPSRFI